MKQLLARASLLADRMIDVDSIIPPKGKTKPIQLKTIFDNLRYYPLLAFLWLGVQILRQGDSWYHLVGAIVLFFMILSLGVLTALQTWAITLMVGVTTISSLLPPRWAVQLRKTIRSKSPLAVLLAAVLVLPILLATWTLAVALLSSFGNP